MAVDELRVEPEMAKSSGEGSTAARSRPNVWLLVTVLLLASLGGYLLGRHTRIASARRESWAAGRASGAKLEWAHSQYLWEEGADDEYWSIVPYDNGSMSYRRSWPTGSYQIAEYGIWADPLSEDTSHDREIVFEYPKLQVLNRVSRMIEGKWYFERGGALYSADR